MQNEFEDDISQLKAENEALKTELEESRKVIEALETKANNYKRVIDVEKAFFSRTSRFGLSIFLGSSLERNIKAWLQAVKPDNLLPIEETANVAAAVIRRMLGNRLLILLGSATAFITVLLLIWQNSLIQWQIDQQAEQTTITRRAQLISILYDRDCSLISFIQTTNLQKSTQGTENIQQEDCPPKSDVRSRGEAVQAFVQLEKSIGIQNPSLGGALLQDISVVGLDLSSINFNGANLANTNFVEANLSNSTFQNANFSNAILSFTSLENSDLSDANFSNAQLLSVNISNSSLFNTNFSKASIHIASLKNVYLGGANFQDTDLTGSNLSSVNFNPASVFDIVSPKPLETTFNNETIWPGGFDHTTTPAINCSNQPNHDACMFWENK
jgi:uncharacterized protein YjbI with pentapeptide repeats